VRERLTPHTAFAGRIDLFVGFVEDDGKTDARRSAVDGIRFTRPAESSLLKKEAGV
jgi:hypothetical protein